MKMEIRKITKYEKYWVIRGVVVKDGIKKVVAEEEHDCCPWNEMVVNFLEEHSECDFATVVENYRLIK